MMKSGQWMEVRRETRPPRTRERRPAAGAKAMWWPHNPEWSLIQWLPREQGSNGEETSLTAQGTYLRGAENSPHQRKSKCNPEEMMIQTTTGQDASGAERNAKPTDTAKIEREGHVHTMEPKGEGQRGNGTLDGSGTMPPEGAADGVQQDVEDDDSGRDSGSLETSWDANAKEPEGMASEASCSTDCSEPRWRVYAARRTTPGKRDSGQRDPVQERSPKRSRTAEDGDTNRQLYIDMDVPRGPEEDGPPTLGIRGHRAAEGTGSSSGALCTCNAPIKVQRGRETDEATLIHAVADKMASKKGRAGTIHGLLRDLAVFVRERSGGEDTQTAAEENYVTVLQAMQNDEMERWDVSPTGDISPTGD